MLILASASERRASLLSKLTDKFKIITADVAELSHSLHPADIVMDLATIKAQAVADKYPCDTVIGADTIVYYKDKVLGKPKDKADAIACLRTLSGNTHCVYTGVCVIKGGRAYRSFDLSKVKMRELSDTDINRYVDGGSPMDKAGAYGIQDGVADSYIGSYDNIVGLPTQLLSSMPALAEDL